MTLIAGLVEWTSSDAVADCIHRMLGCFARSTPDDVRVKATSTCGVGVSQPFAAAGQQVGGGPSSSLGLLAVVDGRFDNLDTIRDELDLPLTSSEDLVSVGYRRWGTDLFRRLQGEYAIAIWDSEAQALIAARDPFSIRPLYYSASSTKVLLASDPEQILASGLVSAVPDDHSVVEYLLWDFRSIDRSFFRDISRLPGGHVLVARQEGWRVSQFRRPIVNNARLGDQREYWAEFHRLFRQAVRRRIQSTSPVGAQLSGGVDSSSIVCVADNLLKDDPAICPQFFGLAALHPGLDCDEEVFVRAVQSHLNADVEVWNGTLADPLELAASPAGLPGARFAMTGGTQGDIEIARRRGAAVILSGVGGDQIGIPTGTLEDAVVEMRWKDAWRIVSGAPGATVSSVCRTSARTLKSIAPPWLQAVREELRAKDKTHPAWLTELAGGYSGERALPREAGAALGTNLQRSRWLDLIAPRTALSIEYFQNHALRNGIELRFPFFDTDLVAFVLSVPSRFWPPPWPQERLQRDALRGVLPDEIFRRRTKANFSSALTNRVRKQLAVIRGLFASRKWAAGRYVHQPSARITLAEFEQSENPSFTLTYSVWAIASLESWLHTLLGYGRVLSSEAPDVRAGGHNES